MKAGFCIVIVVLTALVAHGRELDRAALNAMLDSLAASPEPRPVCGPVYSRCCVPNLEEFDYHCEKCGNLTHYPPNICRIKWWLGYYRDAAARFREKGLRISVDESALCRHCTPLKILGIPTSGVVDASSRDSEQRNIVKDLGFQVGQRVRMCRPYKYFCSDLYRIEPMNAVYWISENCLDSSGKVIKDAWVRFSPDTKARIGVCRLYKGDAVSRLPRQPGDPKKWTRIAASEKITEYGFRVDKSALKDLTYDGEGQDAAFERSNYLSWVLFDGHRTIVESSDVELLERFLDGDVYVNDGSEGHSVSTRSQLPRLREILGSQGR